MAKKKNETVEVVIEVGPSAADHLAEQVRLNGGPESGTVVRFEYTFETASSENNRKKDRRMYYTYTALWVANSWYISGENDSLTRRQSNQAFMILLANEQVRNAEVATEFSQFKA